MEKKLRGESLEHASKQEENIEKEKEGKVADRQTDGVKDRGKKEISVCEIDPFRFSISAPLGN